MKEAVTKVIDTLTQKDFHETKGNLWAMAMKEDTTFPKATALLELHYQIV